MRHFVAFISVLLLTFVLSAVHGAEPSKTIELWNGTTPGDKGDLGEETDTTKPSDHMVAEKRVARIGNVSKPTIAIYKPAKAKANGTAVLVCPGGGYNILAIDLEGTEVCDWLNANGITAVLLKYRVPKRKGLEKHTSALQDAQRALGLLRFHANEWGIAPDRIGVLGFSAGGHLAAALGSNCETRSYPATDDADAVSCRPDFTVLVYPAYLTVKEENDKVAPELSVTSSTPPTFIAMAEDDPLRIETVLMYSVALRKAKVPFELHVYPSGGHGFGLRPTKDLATTWPQRAAEWIEHLDLKQQ